MDESVFIIPHLCGRRIEKKLHLHIDIVSEIEKNSLLPIMST